MKEISAVIMAGGKGTRLRPYTLVLPKPLMPIGEQPVIELLLKWLRRWNIKNVSITTGYLGKLIQMFCQDGSQWDLSIVYSEEPEPLGTIGALRLVQDKLPETFIVLNGDLITDLNLSAMIEYHRKAGGLVTVGITSKTVNVDLGVLETHEGRVVDFREKPKMSFQVSMGIYVMERRILELIPRGVPFGFDSLMHAMLAEDLPVYTFMHNGLWLDIGQPDDYSQAQQAFQREYKHLILGS
jgi:NDP-mannose synthase